VVKIKICIVASAGGHLAELQSLLPVISEYDYFYVTFYLKNVTTNLPERTYFVVNPDIRNPRLGIPAFAINFFQSLFILLKERPNVVITSGATVAFTFCYLAKFLLKSRIIFIETMSRINSPSLIGRLLHPIADVFIVQWRSMLKFYPKAIYGGCLL
jgi:UDP-N-acetylglucosamine:LPS N-acetylglucosamine transferase